MKILCLHGRLQDAEIFSQRLHNLQRKLRALVEFVYIDGPHFMPITPSQTVAMRCWWHSKSHYQGCGGATDAKVVWDWKISLQSIEEAWKDSGPFDGVLGFSNGAAAAFLLCATSRRHQDRFPGLKFVIISGGYVPEPLPRLLPGETLDSGLLKELLTLPSLHTMSSADTLVSVADSQALASNFVPATRQILLHDGGHIVPQKAEYAAVIHDFIAQFAPIQSPPKQPEHKQAAPEPSKHSTDNHHHVEAAAVAAPPPAPSSPAPAATANAAPSGPAPYPPTEEQLEELEALQAIYMDEYHSLSEQPPRFTIALRETDQSTDPEELGPPARLFSLTFTLPQDYPNSAGPLMQLVGPLGSNDPLRLALMTHLEDLAAEAAGAGGCIMQLVGDAREWINANVPEDVGMRKAGGKAAATSAGTTGRAGAAGVGQERWLAGVVWAGLAGHVHCSDPECTYILAARHNAAVRQCMRICGALPPHVWHPAPSCTDVCVRCRCVCLRAQLFLGVSASLDLCVHVSAPVSSRLTPVSSRLTPVSSRLTPVSSRLTPGAAAAPSGGGASPGLGGEATTASSLPWYEEEETDPAMVRQATEEVARSYMGYDGEEQGGADEESTARAAAPCVEVQQDFELAQHGRWDYVVGLVGKPSAGKSTFYNAVTNPIDEADAARVAAFPFTTIAPNVGRGFVAVPDPTLRLGLAPATCLPLHGYLPGFSPDNCSPSTCSIDPLKRWVLSTGWGPDQMMWRRVPITIKDVAGLVPGAYSGRGRGNAFLNDLCDADVLIHVVDISGSTDKEGNQLEKGEGADPVEDIRWVQAELHHWIFDNVRAKWSTVLKKPARLAEMFSGYHASRSLVNAVLSCAGIARGSLAVEGASLSHWGALDLHRLVAHFLRARFPILLALNKADMEGAAPHISRVLSMLPHEAAVPVCAAGERWLCQQRRAGLVTCQDGSGHASLSESCSDNSVADKLRHLQANVLDVYGTTGALLALTCAVAMRPPRPAFPVADLDTCVALAASCHGAGGGVGGIIGAGADLKVRVAQGAAAGVLRDVVLLRPGSSVEELFHTLKRPPYLLLEGDYVRAECRVLTGGAAGGSVQPACRLVKKDEQMCWDNCVVRVMTNRKVSWQKK